MGKQDESNELEQSLKGLLKPKIVGGGLPAGLLLLLVWLIHGQLKAATSASPILAIIVYMSLFLGMLVCVSFLYIIRLLIKEIGRKSDYTKQLEMIVLKNRKSTKEKNDKH